MVTVNGLFDKRSQANAAAEELEAEGISREDISVISSGSDTDDHDPSGAIVGAVMGGAAGLLAGLASVTILGIGPAVGVGWLATSAAATAAGSATGGLIGSMVAAGIDKDDAHVYAEGIKRGGTLLSAKVSEPNLASVKAMLLKNDSVDITLRREAYKLSGWEGFNDEYVSNADLEDDDNRRV